jgi:methylated-DNA-[protein]-cysteine S-methyltransferase
VRPTLVRYEAPGWGVGELWLDGDRVLECSHPRPGRADRQVTQCYLAERLVAWFEGAADDFLDVELDEDDGFYGECQRVLRRVPRGEVVTYGELAALAGRPGAGRAAGTFCARNRFGIFVPCHRVVGSTGLGGYGDLGLEYKRRLLRMEGVAV